MAAGALLRDGEGDMQGGRQTDVDDDVFHFCLWPIATDRVLVLDGGLAIGPEVTEGAGSRLSRIMTRPGQNKDFINSKRQQGAQSSARPFAIVN